MGRYSDAMTRAWNAARSCESGGARRACRPTLTSTVSSAPQGMAATLWPRSGYATPGCAGRSPAARLPRLLGAACDSGCHKETEPTAT